MAEGSNAIKQRNERYNKYVDTVTPKTSIPKALFHSFAVGGTTCVIGQGIGDIIMLISPTMSIDMVANITSMPITGFANAMASASMEFKTEGLIFGTSVKLFSVVGPVVVNGIVWSSLAGLINLWILGMY